MSVKTIQIQIPESKNISDVVSCFSPEENYLMIKIGSECIIEGRKAVTSLTQNEIYQKLKNDTQKEVEKLEMDLLVKDKINSEMEIKIKNMYETQIEKYKQQLINVSKQLEDVDNNNIIKIENAIKKETEKYEIMYKEKEKQVDKLTTIYEKLVKQNEVKSSIQLGDKGEEEFAVLANTFKDFEGYRLENKSQQGHKGDFHLFFKDFNILVDSKNYSTSVSKKEILKIESDLNTNSNMHYAWLVSLNSNICEYNKFPITPKWITTDDGKVKCILMINNLLDNKDPRNVLRQAWQICNDFHMLTRKVEKEDCELEEYRKNNLICKKQIENLQERAAELRRGVNTTYNILKHMDNDLLEMLSNVSDKMISDKFKLSNKIKDWWNDNIEYLNDDSKMTSTEIWNKFKRENKDYIIDNNITIETFKDILTTNIVSSSNYIEKTKKGAIEFVGFKWREKEIEIEKIENLELENIIIEKPKKVKKGKSDGYYFDKEIDEKILNDYENISNDIMNMSNKNVRPWQIVSLLMRYKIINTRGEARGYDKYKETEEYKKKLEKD